jgi:hypothetical protein
MRPLTKKARAPNRASEPENHGLGLRSVDPVPVLCLLYYACATVTQPLDTCNAHSMAEDRRPI